MTRFLLFAIMAFTLQACEPTLEGNGNVKEETREAAPFDKIEVSGNFDIFIKPGNYSAVTIQADENLLEHIESYVSNGKLKISSKKKFSHFEKLNVYITMNALNGLELSGACEVRTEGQMQGKDVEMDFSGAVEAKVDLICEKLDVDMSGACELHLRGEGQKAKFETSGAGEINAEDFKTEECEVDMSGAGEARVYATNKLDIDISGAAEVRYRGNPGEINQNVSGAASIKPL